MTPDSVEAPSGGVKAGERSLASAVQKAGTPAPPPTKHRRREVLRGNPRPWGRRAVARAGRAAVAGSPPA